VADLRAWLASLMGDDPEATGAAASSTAMEPVTGPILGGAASGDNLKQGLQSLMGGYQWDPSLSGQQNAMAMAKDPSQLDTATGVAMGVGPGAIRAYHGSPHSFDKFDSSRIGTGEGAQVYGHGLYFAQAEPVAENYLQNATWKYGNQKAETIYDRLNNQANERGLDNAGWDRLNAQRTFWEKVALGRAPRSVIDDALANPHEYGPAELAYIQSLDPAKFKRSGGGNMYEVNINADPKQFLDWDKPLAGQQHIQDVLSDVMLDRWPGAWNRRTYKTIEDNIDVLGRKTGDAVYRQFSENPAEAAKLLQAQGIPGIRYLDQGSRDAGQGTSNFVTFPGNDHLIEILRKYGLLGTLGAGTAAASSPYAGIMQGGEQ